MEREGASAGGTEGNRRARETLRPSLAKGTRETPRRRGRMEGRDLSCASYARELGAGREERRGVWGRHALKIGRAAKRGWRQDAGK